MRQPGECAVIPAADPDALEPLLELLRSRDDLDLRGYRRGTLARRVQNRMMAAGVPTLSAYLERLRADRAETPRLLERLTIKVSRFFRNAFAVGVVARALEAELARGPRRLSVWSAGCGRGEEPYTLAMVLAELGQERGAPQVLATDIDPSALSAAAAGVYAPEALAEVSPEVRARYFRYDEASGAWRVAEHVRRRVELGRHDLSRAAVAPGTPPFDLVSCRNTLIYFEPCLQRRATALLCAALRPGGLLWLGESEWPSGDVARRLRTVDRKARLFQLAAEDGSHA
jgi:chemotaxis protein methyltransferase CheR